MAFTKKQKKNLRSVPLKEMEQEQTLGNALYANDAAILSHRLEKFAGSGRILEEGKC